MSAKVLRVVTDRLVAALEEGTIPWVKPWTVAKAYNADTKHVYTGVNALLLGLNDQGPAFLTWNAIKKYGGTVKPGFKQEIVVYAGKVRGKRKVDGTEGDEFFMLKYTRVVPLSYVDGMPQRMYDEAKAATEAMGADHHTGAQEIIDASGATIKFGGSRACYSPSHDTITLPVKEAFHDTYHYYSTALHELVHWSGHESRLNRIKGKVFGDLSYAGEELVAEMGATGLCYASGMDFEAHLDNAKAYCQNWAQRLRDNPTIIATCAKKAEEAASYLLDLAGFGKEEETDELDD